MSAIIIPLYRFSQSEGGSGQERGKRFIGQGFSNECGTKFPRTGDYLVLHVRRHHRHRHVWTDRADARDELKSIGARHVEVDQGDIDRASRDGAQGLFGVNGFGRRRRKALAITMRASLLSSTIRT
jgi:hypothetical protein